MYLRIIIIGIVLFIQNSVFSQNLDQIELNKRLSILNGKVFLSFPAEARNEGRNQGIMSTPTNGEEETRIIYDIEGKRVVFFAKNLFCKGDNNLFNEISEGKGEILKYKRKVLIDRDSIYAVLSTPITTNTEGSGMLVNSLIVKIQDNTVLKIQAYISPEAYAEKEKYIKFTESIFKTVSKGNRTTILNERTEILPLELDNYKYQIDFPKNYSYSVDKSYDFKVTKIIKYGQYNSDKPEIIIYSGNHPSYFFKQYKFKYPGEVVKGLFINQEIEWNTYSDVSKGIFLKERVITTTEDPNAMDLHIAMISDSQESIDELTKIVESIKCIGK